MTKIDNFKIQEHIQKVNEQFAELKEAAPSSGDDQISTLLQKARVAVTDTIPIPPTCLEVVDPMDSSTLGTLGNIVAVIGKAKSRKTFMVTMALAAATKNGLILDKVKVSLPDGKSKVVFFDTEQSKYYVQKIVRRVCHLSEDMNPRNFECYALRPYPTEKRRESIQYIIDNEPDLGMVVIDGIRDLIKDINSPEESTNIVGDLMRWSEEKNILIVVVLHQNKGDNNARGHLGTELINKAESVISVTKDSQDQNISIVEPEFCKGKDFGPFAFKIDEKGMPYVLNDWQPPKGGKKTHSPFDYPKETHTKLLGEVFQRNSRPKYSELWQEIKYSFQQYGITGGNNKAKDWVTYYINQDMIVKTKDGGKSPLYSLPS